MAIIKKTKITEPTPEPTPTPIACIPSTIYWKDGTTMCVWLSSEDTRLLVETFINGTQDIVNVQNFTNGGLPKLFLHILVPEIQAILEGSHTL